MIEVMVSLTVIAIIIVAFQVMITHAVRASRVNQSEFQANLYLRESVEITRVLEYLIGKSETKNEWDEFFPLSCSLESRCHFVESGNSWTTVNGIESIPDSIYTRDFYIESINEDTRKFIAEIFWNNGITSRSLKLETYVYRDIY